MTLPGILWRLTRLLLAYKRRAEYVRPPPIRLWVETASACNLRCPMCYNKDLPVSQKKLMTLDMFQNIVRQARHFANDMYLHHRGEPLLNPALFDMIACARDAGLKTRFHSNGALLNPTRVSQLLKAAPDLVSFSVDGFDKTLYENIRVGADFDQTVANILALLAARASARLKKPYVVIEKIRFRNPHPSENTENVRQWRRKFLEAGADEVIEKDEYVWATPDAPEPTLPRSSSACTFPWYAMVICADGTVTPCPQDFWAHMPMGNVANASLLDIWNDAPYRNLRRQFKSNVENLPLCAKCDRLRRKTVAGVPFQYAVTFLVDQLVGYNRFRSRLGTQERR